jgi:hypothetical protein
MTLVVLAESGKAIDAPEHQKDFAVMARSRMGWNGNKTGRRGRVSSRRAPQSMDPPGFERHQHPSDFDTLNWPTSML